MKVFLAGLFHETNTFTGTETPPEAFEKLEGEALRATRGDGSPRDGFLSTAESFGWHVVPAVDWRAHPSGIPSDAVLEGYWNALRPQLDAALDGGVDALFLILHGAMATPSFPDAEGELLDRIRRRPGAQQIPLFAVLDLHANVSPRMARHASALIPYRRNPHTDARETAVRATFLLRRCLTSGVVPRTRLLPARMLLAPPETATDRSPMRDLAECARELEQSAGHWEVGIAAGFAHADTPDTGLTFWVVSDRPEMACQRSLETLFSRAGGLAVWPSSGEMAPEAALAVIAREKKFPALLVEPADNIGGGAPGDGDFLLRALLETRIGPTGVIINAPRTVAALAEKTPGESVTFTLRSAGGFQNPDPLTLTGILERRSEGKFELEDSQSHLASLAGCRIDMGPCVVITVRHITLLLTSRATPPFDLGQWRSQGIDPEKLAVITVKAAVGHRRAYDPITGSTFTVSTPGPCSSDLRTLPYRKLRRPIRPLDEIR